MNIQQGLYLVSTPIGNLSDLSPRAVEVLKASDLILAEDTRHSGILLKHHSIKGPMDSFNDFNKQKKTPSILSKLETGQTISLISDAGTPGIADPGFYLVRAARAKNIKVGGVPGPCAFISALVISGMPTDHFLFSNFPPKKSAQRRTQLEHYKALYTAKSNWVPTIGFYIGTKQLVKFLTDIAAVFGKEHRVVLVRELTKIYEEVLDRSAEELLDYYSERQPRGEYVLFLHPQNKGLLKERTDEG